MGKHSAPRIIGGKQIVTGAAIIAVAIPTASVLFPGQLHVGQPPRVALDAQFADAPMETGQLPATEQEAQPTPASYPLAHCQQLLGADTLHEQVQAFTDLPGSFAATEDQKEKLFFSSIGDGDYLFQSPQEMSYEGKPVSVEVLLETDESSCDYKVRYIDDSLPGDPHSADSRLPLELMYAGGNQRIPSVSEKGCSSQTPPGYNGEMNGQQVFMAFCGSPDQQPLTTA